MKSSTNMTDTPVNLQHALHAAGYQLDSESRVWCSPGFGSIDYSDGDGAENLLLETLRGARDVSVFSSELAAACRDWPSRYHLSTERANLLRPFSAVLVSVRRYWKSVRAVARSHVT